MTFRPEGDPTATDHLPTGEIRTASRHPHVVTLEHWDELRRRTHADLERHGVLPRHDLGS